MALALQKSRRAYRLKLYEGGSHDLAENLEDVRQEMDRWLDRYVRDGKPAPPNGVAVLPASTTDERRELMIRIAPASRDPLSSPHSARELVLRAGLGS